jgi:hypothetical protein
MAMATRSVQDKRKRTKGNTARRRQKGADNKGGATKEARQR